MAELAIRLTASGIKTYYKGQLFHFFDTLIVLASAVDVVTTQILNSDGDDNVIYKGSAITALRAIRIMRVFKLSREWKRFELLLDTMGNTLKDVASFSFLLFLFTFIFTLLGLELFAYQAKLDPDTLNVDLDHGVSPTFNFDTFLNSFSLVFIILTNDGQAAVFYNYYRAVSPVGATIFWILLVLVGQKIILNLFVAILLENFDEGALK
jgi:voltage-dependent calcium channel N type alpha-1B